MDIVDIAYQIIHLAEDNKYLRGRVDHYKELERQNAEMMDDSIKQTWEAVGNTLTALLNPKSFINKGAIKEQLKGEK